MNIQKIITCTEIKAQLENLQKYKTGKNFAQTSSMLFESIKQKPYNLAGNIYYMGRFLKQEMDRLNESKIQLLLSSVKDLLKFKTSRRNKECIINAVNIIYSTILKSISPSLILKGKVKADTYKQIVQDSIKMYRRYPLNEGIDYRHIFGRMVSLKTMSNAVYKKFSYIPDSLKPLEWTSSEQLDYIEVLEKILKRYDTICSDFKVKSSASSFSPEESFDLESVELTYRHNLIKTLKILNYELFLLMKSPHKNTDEIKNKIELIHFYFDKIPSEFLPQALRILNTAKKYESELVKK